VPGGRRIRGGNYPFCYLKICETVGGFLLVLGGLTLSFVTNVRWLVFFSFGSGTLLLTIICQYVVWRFLPPHVRARIPYDEREAIAKKGDIHSYRQLLKLL